MDFAKTLLSRYGWEEGKGLGKHEDGITQAIKPKLKFDNAGIGHDRAETFTHYWWEHAFNDAVNNITVCQIENDISLKTAKEFDVSTKKVSSKNRKNLVFNNFLRSATTLTKEGVIVTSEEDVIEETEPVENVDVMTGPAMTDAQLFAACGGRTAHKGARHGLGLSGKLARVEEQERKALAMMINKAEITLSEEEETKRIKKKKKSKKTSEESTQDGTDREEDERKEKRLEEDVQEEDENGKKEKRKKSKREAATCSDSEVHSTQDGDVDNSAVKRKKGKKSLDCKVIQSSETENNTEKRKKSKREAVTCSDSEVHSTQDGEADKRKKRKKSKSSEEIVVENTSEKLNEASEVETVCEKRKKKKKRKVLEDEQTDGNNQDSISPDADVDNTAKKVKKSKRKRGETVE